MTGDVIIYVTYIYEDHRYSFSGYMKIKVYSIVYSIGCRIVYEYTESPSQHC